MNLQDNQFLKIRLTERGNLYFEIYEQPFDKWRRPLRWSIIVPRANIVNRHKKESKFRLLISTLANLHWAFLEEFYPEQIQRMITTSLENTGGKAK